MKTISKQILLFALVIVMILGVTACKPGGGSTESGASEDDWAFVDDESGNESGNAGINSNDYSQPQGPNGPGQTGSAGQNSTASSKKTESKELQFTDDLFPTLKNPNITMLYPESESEYRKMQARDPNYWDSFFDVKPLFAEKYGGKDLSLEVKGLEYPQYEPRGSWGMSLAYAVSDRGACHMRAYAPNNEVFEASIPPYTAEGKGEMVYELGEFNAVKFSSCICDFWATISYEILAELLTLTTGRDWTPDEMGDVGRRVLNIARAFNQREGFNRKDDTIPKKLVKQALKKGPGAGQMIPQEAFDDMLDQYYEVMGWDKDGMMPDDLIQSLL